VVHERRLAPLLLALAMLTTAAWAASHLAFVLSHAAYLKLLPLWSLTFVLSSLPLFIGWADRPYQATPRQQRQLDRLHVVTAVPVYNEDPGLLDRCLWSLANSSRPPDVIHVVEDGPSVDYSVLREHWLAHCPAVTWTVLAQNAGKKHAQAEVFTAHPAADIFITVDSDTTLEHHAVREGLKPFADPGVSSVAGIEEVYNKRKNWLTMAAAARNTYCQLVSWSTQSVFGDVLINRGTFALYRAETIREIVPAYLGETFLGRPIKLGDDSMLTLFSRARGRTVQQVTAFSLPMYPETLSHHLRQWTRWSRGGSIRNYWRTRYLPVTSWGWWWTVLSLFYTIGSLAMPVVLALTWPRSERPLAILVLSAIIWAYAASPHVLRVRRQGEGAWFRLGTMLAYPAGLLWSFYCLRPVRLYGIVTCLRQGWVTRQAGVEVTTEGSQR
jgi:hyaluronan synthase